MHKRTLIAVALLAVLAVAPEGRCGDKMPLAVVNFDRVMLECERTQLAMKELKRQESDFSAVITRRLDRVREMESAFDAARKEAQEQGLAEDVRKSRLEKAERLLVAVKEAEQDIRKYRDGEGKRIMGEAAGMRNMVGEEIREIVNTMAAEKGLKLILNSSGGDKSAVLYCESADDLTDEVIRRMNSGGVVREKKGSGK